MAKKKTNHYVDNKKFLEVMTEYRQAVETAKENGDKKPKVPDYVGECLLKIATNLARKPNFYRYWYVEEMVSDGIENCLMYIDNFDPSKSKNPFAYFTQIIYYAFLRRIDKEHKQLYTKYKLVVDGKAKYHNTWGAVENTDQHDNMKEFIENFERKRTKKKESA